MKNQMITIHIDGPQGCGKTTLALMLAYLLKNFNAGEVPIYDARHPLNYSASLATGTLPAKERYSAHVHEEVRDLIRRFMELGTGIEIVCRQTPNAAP